MSDQIKVGDIVSNALDSTLRILVLSKAAREEYFNCGYFDANKVYITELFAIEHLKPVGDK